MASSSAAAPSAYRRHQVCQTCLRASSSFVKKLRLGADPSEQAFNLEQCLTCSQKARTASQTQLPEEGTGDGAQPQLRPRRLFLKDASPFAPASSAADAAAGADGLDLNSSREGLEGDECPPVAPSSPAAVHALPAHTLPAVTPWRAMAPVVPPTPGAPGSARRCKSGDLQRPRPRSGGSPSAGPSESPQRMATHGEAHSAAHSWTPADTDGGWSPPVSRGAPPEAPPPAPADGKQAVRRGGKPSDADVAALTSGLCGISLGKRTHEECL